MVKHVIIWKLKEELGDAEGAEVKKNAKAALEALGGKIDGLLDIKVVIDFLPSSNGDMMLDTTFESAEALAAYQVHPDHVSAADSFVRPFTNTRLCCDFEV